MRPLPLPSGIRSTEARPSLPPSTIEAPGAANVAVAPGPVGTIVVPNDDASQRTVALQTTAALPVTIEEVEEPHWRTVALSVGKAVAAPREGKHCISLVISRKQ